MFSTLFAIILLPWLQGFSKRITCGMIHPLLFVAVAAAIVYLVEIQRWEAKRPVPVTRNSELPRI